MSGDMTKNRRKEVLERARRIAGDPSWTPPKRGTPEELKARRTAQQIIKLNKLWTKVARSMLKKPYSKAYKVAWTTETEMHAIGEAVKAEAVKKGLVKP